MVSYTLPLYTSIWFWQTILWPFSLQEPRRKYVKPLMIKSIIQKDFALDLPDDDVASVLEYFHTEVDACRYAHFEHNFLGLPISILYPYQPATLSEEEKVEKEIAQKNNNNGKKKRCWATEHFWRLWTMEIMVRLCPSAYPSIAYFADYLMGPFLLTLRVLVDYCSLFVVHTSLVGLGFEWWLLCYAREDILQLASVLGYLSCTSSRAVIFRKKS